MILIFYFIIPKHYIYFISCHSCLNSFPSQHGSMYSPTPKDKHADFANFSVMRCIFLWLILIVAVAVLFFLPFMVAILKIPTLQWLAKNLCDWNKCIDVYTLKPLLFLPSYLLPISDNSWAIPILSWSVTKNSN